MNALGNLLNPIRDHAIEGAEVGALLAGDLLTQELVTHIYSNYVAFPKSDTSTCLEGTRALQLPFVLLLTGALVGGATGAIGLDSRVFAAAASVLMAYDCLSHDGVTPNFLQIVIHPEGIIDPGAAVAIGFVAVSLCYYLMWQLFDRLPPLGQMVDRLADRIRI